MSRGAFGTLTPAARAASISRIVSSACTSSDPDEHTVRAPHARVGRHADPRPHDVKFHRTGEKRFHYTVVGDLTLTFEALELPGDPGQTIFAYTPEPNSRSHEAINLLAGWASTPEGNRS